MKTKTVELWVEKETFDENDAHSWYRCRMPTPADKIIMMESTHVLCSVEVPLKERKIEVTESQIRGLMEYFDYNSEEVIRELFGADDEW